MTARQRIDEIQRILVAAVMESQEKEPLTDFMKKISGTSDADMAEYWMKNTDVRIEAIITYLDEVAAK